MLPLSERVGEGVQVLDSGPVHTQTVWGSMVSAAHGDNDEIGGYGK